MSRYTSQDLIQRYWYYMSRMEVQSKIHEGNERRKWKREWTRDVDEIEGKEGKKGRTSLSNCREATTRDACSPKASSPFQNSLPPLTAPRDGASGSTQITCHHASSVCCKLCWEAAAAMPAVYCDQQEMPLRTKNQ